MPREMPSGFPSVYASGVHRRIAVILWKTISVWPRVRLADQVIVGIGSFIRDHFQRLACTPKHRRNNPLIKEVRSLLGLILDERFDLTVVEVDAEPWNTDGHTHNCTSLLRDH